MWKSRLDSRNPQEKQRIVSYQSHLLMVIFHLQTSLSLNMSAVMVLEPQLYVSDCGD